MSEAFIIQLEDNEVQKSLKESPVKFKKGCLYGLRKAGQIVKADIQRSILLPKTGRKYAGLPNRSSAPGEAPANQSGTLRKSVTYKAYMWNFMEVGDEASYGGYLERGAKYLRPRPHISTAASRTFNTVQMIISMEIDKELSK